MKILFCGGGTFGHVAPSLSVANDLKKRYPDAKLFFVGRKNGKENESIRRDGYPLFEISMQSIGRKIDRENLNAIFTLMRAFGTAKRLLKEIQPDVVFGTGGYVCYPIVRAAQHLKIATVLHESNAIPGRACRRLAPKCKAVFLGVKEAEDAFPPNVNCIFTGNPVREEFFRINREEARRRLGIPRDGRLLLSFGGSGGAERINEAMVSFMKNTACKKKNIYHVHIAGRKYYERLAALYPSFTEKKSRCRILPFIDEMPLYMCGADLCICRSGAMTVSELAAAKAPAILVPSPNVTDDHQRKNAQSLMRAGGALCCEEEALQNSTNLILSLLRDREKIAAMRTALASYGERDAARKIADALICILPRNK